LSDLRFHASRRPTQVVHCGLTGVSPSSIAKLDARTTDLGEVTVLLCRRGVSTWRRSNLSSRTIRAYTDDGGLLAAFLAPRGMPTAVLGIRREDWRRSSWPELERTSPSSAATRYLATATLQVAGRRGEIDASTMAKVRRSACRRAKITVKSARYARIAGAWR
jgi:hypothetical protein